MDHFLEYNLLYTFPYVLYMSHIMLLRICFIMLLRICLFPIQWPPPKLAIDACEAALSGEPWNNSHRVKVGAFLVFKLMNSSILEVVEHDALDGTAAFGCFIFLFCFVYLWMSPFVLLLCCCFR